jgi:hypothetical protein
MGEAVIFVMPQDMIDFMESEEGVRFVAVFERITD